MNGKRVPREMASSVSVEELCRTVVSELRRTHFGVWRRRTTARWKWRWSGVKLTSLQSSLRRWPMGCKCVMQAEEPLRSANAPVGRVTLEINREHSPGRRRGCSCSVVYRTPSSGDCH